MTIENKTLPMQWESLASPGHALMTQVDLYRLKRKKALIGIAVAVALVPASLYVAHLAGSGVGGAAGWITGTVAHWFAPSAIPTSPAPAVKPMLAVIEPVQFDPAILPSLKDDVMPAMDAQVEAMKRGEKMTQCDFTRKVTQPWFDGLDATPKCRYSADGDRLWVWAYVKDGYQTIPFAGLIVKADGKVTFANLAIPGVAQLPGHNTLDLNQIPRTVAADFPELLMGN